MTPEREKELREDIEYKAGTHPRFWKSEEVRELLDEIDRLRAKVNEYFEYSVSVQKERDQLRATLKRIGNMSRVKK